VAGGKMRCLVIEDEAETARYLTNGLKEAGFTVLRCGNGVDGLHLATSERWDVVILDRLLPGDIDGLSIVGRLRELGKTTPVLILSALASLDERVRGLRSGGDDYLTKPFAFSELLARVQALLRRSGVEHDVAELWLADLKLDLRRRKVERAAQPIAVQPREFRLLEYLMRHQGQVVTRTMLLEHVWGEGYMGETHLLQVNINRLRRKLEPDTNHPRYLLTKTGIGYLLASEPTARS